MHSTSRSCYAFLSPRSVSTNFLSKEINHLKDNRGSDPDRVRQRMVYADALQTLRATLEEVEAYELGDDASGACDRCCSLLVARLMLGLLHWRVGCACERIHKASKAVPHQRFTIILPQRCAAPQCLPSPALQIQQHCSVADRPAAIPCPAAPATRADMRRAAQQVANDDYLQTGDLWRMLPALAPPVPTAEERAERTAGGSRSQLLEHLSSQHLRNSTMAIDIQYPEGADTPYLNAQVRYYTENRQLAAAAHDRSLPLCLER